jgi:hypothetical protein
LREASWAASLLRNRRAAGRNFGTFKKLEEFKETDSLEPNEPVAFFWRRNARAWVEAQVRGLVGEIDMPEIGVRLQMAAIYGGVEFPVRLRLVSTDE